MTVVATRLMRVTGDGFFAARVVFAADFFTGFLDFAALLRLAALFDALLDALFDALFDAFFALLLPRDAARFDAVDDLRRAFPPDDFDAGAMIDFLEGRYATTLRKIRARCRGRRRTKNKIGG
jgi:hypothetical protein